MKLHNDSERHLCGFRFELAISGTTLSLMKCYDVVRNYQLDVESVSENAGVMRRLSIDEYITNLNNALADAKDAGLYHGRTSSSPSGMQKSLMAEVMNAAGYYSTKWIGYCCIKEQVRVEEDKDSRDELMKDILKRVYTRKSARNFRLVCAATRTSGSIKSFPSHVGLARHLIDEFGEHWYRYLKLINNEREPQGFQCTIRQTAASNLEGSHNIIGRLFCNGQTFVALDAPHDGSCFYYSFSSMIRKHLGGDAPSVRSLMQQLTEYYRHSDTSTKSCCSCSYVFCIVSLHHGRTACPNGGV